MTTTACILYPSLTTLQVAIFQPIHGENTVYLLYGPPVCGIC
jgi:hypothetical protein